MNPLPFAAPDSGPLGRSKRRSKRKRGTVPGIKRWMETHREFTAENGKGFPFVSKRSERIFKHPVFRLTTEKTSDIRIKVFIIIINTIISDF
jgi:hypothetical protein